MDHNYLQVNYVLIIWNSSPVPVSQEEEKHEKQCKCWDQNRPITWSNIFETLSGDLLEEIKQATRQKKRKFNIEIYYWVLSIIQSTRRHNQKSMMFRLPKSWGTKMFCLRISSGNLFSTRGEFIVKNLGRPNKLHAVLAFYLVWKFCVKEGFWCNFRFHIHNNYIKAGTQPTEKHSTYWKGLNAASNMLQC